MCRYNAFRTDCEGNVNDVLGGLGTVRVSIYPRNTLTFNDDQTGRANNQTR
jgi:hypothetical protein